MEVLLVRSFQCRWRLWMPSASWRLRWGASTIIPLLLQVMFLDVLCLFVLQLALRISLSSSGVWCCRSHLVLYSGYLATGAPSVDALPSLPPQRII